MPGADLHTRGDSSSVSPSAWPVAPLVQLPADERDRANNEDDGRHGGEQRGRHDSTARTTANTTTASAMSSAQK